MWSHIYQRRKERQNFTAYKALIETPGNLETGVPILAEADIYASVDVETEETTLVVDVDASEETERNLGIPELPADAPHNIGRLHRGSTITKNAEAPGIVSVFIRDGMGKLHKIGEG